MSQEKGKFDSKVEREMEERIENFLAALKKPLKRVSPDPNVKHDVHKVDTQGFKPSAKIHVEEDENETNIEKGVEIISPQPIE